MAYKDIEVKRAKNREWQRNNRKRQTKYMAGWFRRNLNAWIKYFESKGLNPICQICGRKLKWFSGNCINSATFDHKDGYKKIKYPHDFFRKKAPTNENIEIFENEKLGILCNKHNRFLPTDLRQKIKEYLQ